MRGSRLILPVAFLIAASTCSALPAPERLHVPSLDRDASGGALMIDALYFRPPQVRAAIRIPLVIALHGCGGMFTTRASRSDELSERFAAWTGQLLEDGYAVLLPDSFGPRGYREICTVKTAERAIGVPARRLDALGAVAYARTLPGIDRTRIAMVGWSHGGSTTLAAINARDARAIAAQGTPEAPLFRAAVAFYPGCAAALRAGERWQTTIPTAIHIGELDDWTPAAPCRELGEARRARGDPLTVIVHPGSYHGFDAPSGRVAVRHDVPNGTNPGQGVTTGPNPAARAAANASVRMFLREQLQADGDARGR